MRQKGLGGPGESYHVWCQWRNQKELLGDFKWYDLVLLKFISFCRRKFIFLKQIKDNLKQLPRSISYLDVAKLCPV